MQNMGMTKNRKFDFLTLVIILLLGGALWQAYAPYVLNKQRTEAAMRSTVRITPNEVVEKVKNSEGRPTFFYVYASWCNVCKPFTKLLLERIRDGRMDHIQRIFMSVDKQQYDVARYLQEHKVTDEFVPYMFVQLPGQSLNPLGTRNMRGLPYMAYFDRSGKLIREHSGSLSAFDLDELLAKVPANGEKAPVAAAENPADSDAAEGEIAQ